MPRQLVRDSHLRSPDRTDSLFMAPYENAC
jgi:hypothetical protein